MSLNKVLVTGSSNGLGKHIALFYSKKGYDILLHGRDEKKLKENQEEILKNGCEAKYIVADLVKNNDIDKLCETAKKLNINVLINNAGIICTNLTFENIDNKIIDDMINVNLIAPIKIIRKLSKNLKNIININSMVGLEAKKNRTLYAASKWGLRGFSDSLKKEDVKYNILDVYPTNIKTWQDREDAMEIDFVVEKIYNSMIDGKTELILDGRK